MPETGSRPDRTVPQVAERQCEPCTACCDGWLKIEVYGHQIDRGAPCPFSTGQNCKIYQQRPQDPCREFICGWRAHNSPLPEWMRPDKAGMILLAANFSWQGHPVDVAVRVGRSAADSAAGTARVSPRPAPRSLLRSGLRKSSAACLRSPP